MKQSGLFFPPCFSGTCCLKPPDPHTWWKHHRHGSESQPGGERGGTGGVPFRANTGLCVCVCVISQMAYQLRIPVVLLRWWWLVGGWGACRGSMQTHLWGSRGCRDRGGLPETQRCGCGLQEATVVVVLAGVWCGGRCCAVSPAWCIYLQGGSRRGVGCDGASTGSVARSPGDAEAAVAGLIVISWENCKMSPIVLAAPFCWNLPKVLVPFKSKFGARIIAYQRSNCKTTQCTAAV